MCLRQQGIIMRPSKKEGKQKGQQNHIYLSYIINYTICFKINYKYLNKKLKKNQTNLMLKLKKSRLSKQVEHAVQTSSTDT